MVSAIFGDKVKKETSFFQKPLASFYKMLYSNSCRRGVEQLVARRAHNPEVAGSSPAPATNFIKCGAVV